MVIPAHNAGEHLGQALESVLAQTLPADEILVVDDGSTDNTAEVARSYGSAVTYLYQDQRGAGAARNRGIEAATGDWVAFLDADDEWLPEKLAVQCEHLARHEELVWTCGNFYLAPASGPHRLARSQELVQSLGVDCEVFDDYLAVFGRGLYAWTSTVLVRRAVLKEVGLFAEDMPRGQDTDLWFRIAYRHPCIGYLACPLAIYHMDTPGSNTKVYGDVTILIQLLERQLEAAVRAGREHAFRPCASKILQRRIREFVEQGLAEEARLLLRRFSGLLPWRFRYEMVVRLCSPCLADICRAVSKKCKRSDHAAR